MSGTIEFVGGPNDGERHRIPAPFPSKWRFPRGQRTDPASVDPTAATRAHRACHTYRLRRLPKGYLYIYEYAE